MATVEKIARACLKAGYVVSIYHRDAKLFPELEKERCKMLEPELMETVAGA